MEDGREAFFKDHKTQDAVIRNLEVIGQAVRDLGTDRLSDEQPAIPWSQIAGARNVLAHQYLGVDLTLVWNIVERDLPTLKAAIDETAKRLSIQLHGPDDRS
ncbi:MAG: HepT-like ribonuclease domain-containing protein [Thiobacillus sp.]